MILVPTGSLPSLPLGPGQGSGGSALAARAQGWAAFTDGVFIADMLTVLGLALVLASFLAYHPRLRKKARSLAELEGPKTYIMYALVGAMIAMIVRVAPSMALVVFGIGGLLRFRTDVGEAKDTGRVILVTVIGLCCGLQLYVVAVLAAVLGWCLVWVLERDAHVRLTVYGVDARRNADALDAYRACVANGGYRILDEEMHAKRELLILLLRPPVDGKIRTPDSLFDGLPSELRGTERWQQL